MCGIMEEGMHRDTNFDKHREVTTMASRENETYTKLELQDSENSQEIQILFVKGTWYPTHFWLFVLDGHDIWTFNASMEFVAHEANEWGMRVEEWLDKIQMHLSHQHSENNYAFINVGDNTKMLQCSIYNEVRHERQVVHLLLDKTTRCGQVAFEILGLLVDTNAKQNEELAQKTRDIQRMAAEIHELRHNPDEHIKMEHNKSIGIYYHIGMAHEPTHNSKECIQSTWPISRATSLSKDLSSGYYVEEAGHVDESLMQQLAQDDSWENIQILANKSGYHKDDQPFLEPHPGRQYSGHTSNLQHDQTSATTSHLGSHPSVALNREPSSKFIHVPSRHNSKSNSRRTSWNALEAPAEQSSTPSWSLVSNNKTQPKQATYLITDGRDINGTVISEHNDMEHKSLSSKNRFKTNSYVLVQQKVIKDSHKSTTFGGEKESQSRLSNTSVSQSVGNNWSLEPPVLDNEYQIREVSYSNFDNQSSREEDLSMDDNHQSRHSHASTRQLPESRMSQKNMSSLVKNDEQDFGEETSQDHGRQNEGKSQGIPSRAQSHIEHDPSKPNYTNTQTEFNYAHQDLRSPTNSTRILFAPQQLVGSHKSNKPSYARPQCQETLEMPIHDMKLSYHEPSPESMIAQPQQISTQLKIVLKANNKQSMTSSYGVEQDNSSILVDANYITTNPDINNDNSISYQERGHSMTNQTFHGNENDQENMGIPIHNIEDRENQITTWQQYTRHSKSQLQGNASRPQSHSAHLSSTIYQNELPIRITHLRWGVNSTSNPRWKEPSGPHEIVGMLRSSTSGVDQEFQEHHEMVRFSMHDTKQKEIVPESHQWYSGHSSGQNPGGPSRMQSNVDTLQSILHQDDTPSRISHVTWGHNHMQVKGSREVSILDTQTSRPVESRALSTFGSRNSSQPSHNMTTSDRRQTTFGNNSHVEQTMNDVTHEIHERSDSSSLTIPLEQTTIDKENTLEPSKQENETDSKPLSSISKAPQSFAENWGLVSPIVDEQKESKDTTLATTKDEMKNHQDFTIYDEQQPSYNGQQQSISHTTQTMNQVDDDEKSSSLFSTYYEPQEPMVVAPTQQDSRTKSTRPSYVADDNSTTKQSESVSEPSTSSVFSKLSFTPFAQKSTSTKAPIPLEVEDELRRELHRTLGGPSQSTNIGPTNTYDEIIGSRRTSLIRLDNGEVVDRIAYEKALKDNEQGVKSTQTPNSKLDEPNQSRLSTYRSTLQSFAESRGLISPKVDNAIEQKEFIHTNADNEANKSSNTILPIDQQASYGGSPFEEPKEGYGKAMILSRMSPLSWKRGETQRRYSVDNMKPKLELQKRCSQKTPPRSDVSISRQSIQFKDNKMINKPSLSTSSRSPGIVTPNINYSGASQSTRTSQASPKNQPSISFGENNEFNTQVVSNNQDDGQVVASSSRGSSFDKLDINSLKEREVEDPHNFEYNVYDEQKLTPYPMGSLTTMSSSRMSSFAKRSMNKEFDQTSAPCDEDTIQCTANIRFLIPKSSNSSLAEHGQIASRMSRASNPQVDRLGLLPPAEEPWCPYCKGPKEDQNVGQKISLGLRFNGKGKQIQQRQVTRGG